MEGSHLLFASHNGSQAIYLGLCVSELFGQILILSRRTRQESRMSTSDGTYLIDVIRLLVSLVNWQVTLLLLHSVHEELSVASHYQLISNVRLEHVHGRHLPSLYVLDMHRSWGPYAAACKLSFVLAVLQGLR